MSLPLVHCHIRPFFMEPPIFDNYMVFTTLSLKIGVEQQGPYL